MTALTEFVPGLAGSDSDTFTQDNAVWHRAPKEVSYGYVVDDLAIYTLVGRVTETGALIKSVASVSDGSQNPIGILTHGATVDADSNSIADSNSGAAVDTLPGVSSEKRVGFYRDGGWNFDRLLAAGCIDSGWTLDTLRRNVELNGQQFTFDSPQTATPTES